MHSEPHLLRFPQAFDIRQAPRRSFAFILDTKVVEFITLVLLRLLHVHALSVKNLKYIFLFILWTFHTCVQMCFEIPQSLISSSSLIPSVYLLSSFISLFATESSVSCWELHGIGSAEGAWEMYLGHISGESWWPFPHRHQLPVSPQLRELSFVFLANLDEIYWPLISEDPGSCCGLLSSELTKRPQTLSWEGSLPWQIITGLLMAFGCFWCLEHF